MLRVYFGDMENSIYVPFAYFDGSGKYDIQEWLSDDFVREMILDIDKSKVLSPNCIESPVFGQIPPKMLSGGVKTLIVILKEPGIVFNASKCGDNCAKWILKIAELKAKNGEDVLINLRHIMDFGEEPFELFIENTKQTVYSMKELIPIAHELLVNNIK